MADVQLGAPSTAVVAGPSIAGRLDVRTRRLLARLALMASGLVLAVVFVEVALHLLGPRLPGLYNLATFQRYHEVYGFFHRPGARGWVRSAELTSYVQINSRGLRDREIAVPKPPGTYRIMLMGDSFVEDGH